MCVCVRVCVCCGGFATGYHEHQQQQAGSIELLLWGYVTENVLPKLVGSGRAHPVRSEAGEGMSGGVIG